MLQSNLFNGNDVFKYAGLCFVLLAFANRRFSIPWNAANNMLFPEFEDLKPTGKHYAGYWWPRNPQGYILRVLALTYLIDNLERELENESPDSLIEEVK